MFWNGVSADRRWTLDFHGVKNEEQEGDASDEFIDDMDPEVDPCPLHEPFQTTTESEKRAEARKALPGHKLRLELFGPGNKHCWIPLSAEQEQLLGRGSKEVLPKDVHRKLHSYLNLEGEDRESAHMRLASEITSNSDVQKCIAALMQQLLSRSSTATRNNAFVNAACFIASKY